MPSKLTLPSHRSGPTPTPTSWRSPGCLPARLTGTSSPAGRPGSAAWTSPGCPAPRSRSTFGCSAMPGCSASSRVARHRYSGRSSTATRATARRSTSCAFPRTLRLLLWKKLGPLLGLRRRPQIRPRTRARAMGKTLHQQGKSSGGRPFCPRSAPVTSDRCSVPGGRRDGPSPTCSGASTTHRTASSGRTRIAPGISRDGCATGSRRGRVTTPPARSGQRGTHRFERSRHSAGPSRGLQSIRSRGRTRFAGRCGPGSVPKCPWPSSGAGIRAG